MGLPLEHAGPQATWRQVDTLKIVHVVKDLLDAIGADPYCPELVETPARVAKFWKEFIEYDAGELERTFDAIHADQMIVLRDIRGWSLCAHHLLPFSFTATVGYISGDCILGLSKIARVVHKHAHKLQVQERLARDVALEVQQLTSSKGVGVLIRGEHLCMQMRGIHSTGEMVSSVLLGEMLDVPQVRGEFLSLTR